MKKIVILINDTTYAYNLRGAVIRQLVAEGFQVVVACKFLKLKKELEELGCRLVEVDFGRHGTDPLKDLRLMNRYGQILRSEKPDLVLTYNIKPNVYGGMMCRLLGIKYIPNITGLGTAVENAGRLQTLTVGLYRLGLAKASCVFFQNEDNRQFFAERNILPSGVRTRVIPGSGVDLERHRAMPYPGGETVNFLFVARVMKEKGIDIFLRAAEAISARYPDSAFHICGMCDDPEYECILREAENAGTVRYHGEQADMRPFFEMAHCVVHPSYYPEGMSNVLLEAAAHGRPIIATDRAGCRETVDDGISGFVVPIKNEQAVIAAIERFMNMSQEERTAMGAAGRRKMEREFDREFVVQAYMDEIR